MQGSEESIHTDNKDISLDFSNKSLESIRNKLLDTTNRNRLVNFNHQRNICIRIAGESPDSVFKKIMSSSEVKLKGVPLPSIDELDEKGYIEQEAGKIKKIIKDYKDAKLWARELGLNDSFILTDSNVNKASELYSPVYFDELLAKGEKLRLKYNLALEEMGVNILYVAIGFVSWTEDDNSSLKRDAPLILLPISIKRERTASGNEYIVEYNGDQLIENLSLKEKLEREFGIALPKYCQDILPSEYFHSVSSILSVAKPNWRIHNYATIGMFDFSKLIMYEDLDPERWARSGRSINNHPIIKKYFETSKLESSASSLTEEYDIDSIDNVYLNYPLIYDADSSQHSVVVDACKGESLVIEGPPGTGKSQTITNIIASAMYSGKKVLFVAEKMAALSVVKEKLDRAGLGEYCLEMHSHKADKKAIYKKIDSRIHASIPKIYKHPEIVAEEHEKARMELNGYSEVVNQKWLSTGLTINEIFTAFARLKIDLESENVDLEKYYQYIKFTNQDISDYKLVSSDYKLVSSDFDSYISHRKMLNDDKALPCSLNSHPWYGANLGVLEFDSVSNVLKALSCWTESLRKLDLSYKDICNNFIYASMEDYISVTEKELAFVEDFHYQEELLPIRDLDLNYLKGFVSDVDECELIYEGMGKINQSGGAICDDYLEQTSKLVDVLSQDVEGSNRTLYDLINSHYTIKDVQGCVEVLHKYVDDVHRQDEALAPVIKKNRHGFMLLSKICSAIDMLEENLFRERSYMFLEPSTRDTIELLSNKVGLKSSEIKKVELEFLSDDITSLTMLKMMLVNLNNTTGMFKALNKRWRDSRNKLYKMLVNKDHTLDEAKSLLALKIKYKEYEGLLDSRPDIKRNLRDRYEGVSTDLESLRQLLDWYDWCKKEFASHDEQPILRLLFEADADKVLNIRRLMPNNLESMVSYATESVLSVGEMISDSFALFDIDEGLNIDALEKLVTVLLEDIPSLTEYFSKNTLLSDIYSESVMANKVKEIHNKINKKEEALLFVGAKKSLDKTLFERVSKVKESISKYEILSDNLPEFILNGLLNGEGKFEGKSLSSSIKTLKESYINEKSCRASFYEIGNINDHQWLEGLGSNFDKIERRNKKAIAAESELYNWTGFVRSRNSLVVRGLGDFLSVVEKDMLDYSKIKNIYSYLFYRYVCKSIVSKYDSLKFFTGYSHRKLVSKFKDVDGDLEVASRRHLARKIAREGNRGKKNGISSGPKKQWTEMALIKNELGKVRSLVPVRQLMERASNSLQALMPCFMMGPQSVSKFLPHGKVEFDLVVIDEASQVKPEDALGAIARGKQLIVVGDSRQLPPTSFFDRNHDENEEDNAIVSAESILDISKALFKNRELRWHYRSKHESLINFSNQSFYHNNLITFPSAISNSNRGIRYTFVEDGVFVNQVNDDEARLISEEIKQVLKNDHLASLGVVTMNVKQKERVEQYIELLRKEDAEFDSSLIKNEEALEPLFVKNIENVQGDERDKILISFTYGPASRGCSAMPQRFGAINTKSGGRRLNVLLTRAKMSMHIFTSMKQGYIKPNSEGVEFLAKFLGYVEKGEMDKSDVSGRAPDSDFEIAVMQALESKGYSCSPQVGSEGYSIDIGVRDPDNHHNFILGVECDGATYHSAKSARDRDKIRQSVLEGLGWKLHRIWSTDWFANPSLEIERLVKAIELEKSNLSKKEISKEKEYSHSINSNSEAIKISEDKNNIKSEALDQSCDKSTGQSNFLSKGKNAKINSVDASLKDILMQLYSSLNNDENGYEPCDRSILRPAMIDALCNFMPTTRSEFLELIPDYLRSATRPEDGKYIDVILETISRER